MVQFYRGIIGNSACCEKAFYNFNTCKQEALISLALRGISWTIYGIAAAAIAAYSGGTLTGVSAALIATAGGGSYWSITEFLTDVYICDFRYSREQALCPCQCQGIPPDCR